MMKYDNKKIAHELDCTAEGGAYYGNALYVSLDFPFLTENDRDCLRRYMHGSNTAADRFRLQDIAILIRNKWEVPIK